MIIEENSIDFYSLIIFHLSSNKNRGVITGCVFFFLYFISITTCLPKIKGGYFHRACNILLDDNLGNEKNKILESREHVDNFDVISFLRLSRKNMRRMFCKNKRYCFDGDWRSKDRIAFLISLR